jgi:hypothetical protein
MDQFSLLFSVWEREFSEKSHQSLCWWLFGAMAWKSEKLALLWVRIHICASSKMLLSWCFVCVFAKFNWSWNLGCWRIINSLVGDSRIVCVVCEFLIQQQGYEVLTLNENPKHYKCRDCSRCMFERLQWAEYYRFLWFRTVLGICLASIVIMRFRVQGLGSRALWGGGLQNGSCWEIS